jgi:ELWxxDGT repeat protein
VNGLIFFESNDGTHGSELWKTNGTPAGTSMVEDINPSGDSGDGSDFREVLGNKLYFIADDGTHGFEPWITDGTANGTRLLKDIVSGGGTSDSSDGEVISGVLYFTSVATATGQELWRTNGTPTGTKRVADIRPGPQGSSPDLTAIGGTLWMSANDGTHGLELFKYVP